MAKIKQLSPHEAQKIAAGEVVERPANIVKELIENSIDAGATRISIYIEDAGKKLIRIVDNGCGMDTTDAQICFDRHATSKITHVDDLESINSFGFRGEALASIAAISQITLITKEEHALEGTCITLNPDCDIHAKTIACNTGTDLSVRNLFFNVPARKKFLKTTQTEWRAIQLLFNAFCFDYPHIHFSLFTENKQVNNCPATNNLKNRALQILEPTSFQHLLEADAGENNCISIKAIISDHQHYRYDRSGIYFFVNKRWVKNQHLGNAFIKGYTNVIPHGRYPIGAISITVPANEVDINIHPRKEEVKFLHPRKVELALQNMVTQALEKNLSAHLNKEVIFARPAPHFEPSFTQKNAHFTPFNFDTFFAQQSPHNSFPATPPSMQSPVHALQPTAPNDGHCPLSDSSTVVELIQQPLHAQTQPTETLENNILVAQNFHNFRIIGQYNKTYILIEKEDGLFLVDQHAAHERILYELFANRFSDVATIQLLFPQTITLTDNDIDAILPHLEFLTSHGINIEQSGPHQLTVRSLPVHLKEQSINDILREMIGWIHEHKTLSTAEFKKTIDHKLQAQMACKAAVKAGDTLTQETMQELLTTLEKTANRFSCPHGRPTGWLLSLNEIERKFKRQI